MRRKSAAFDGIFGVEASEWETVKDRLAPPDYEKAFLSNPADSFAIYQLRDNDNTAQLRFMNAEYLAQKGLSIEKENYAAVYAGSLDRRGDTQDRLDALYETFNLRRPEDFRGHSLSVSDIVALKQNGVVSCHYVDSRGFKALPDFLKPENYLKNAEMAMEDDYGMIDGVINNGPKQTVAELEKQAKSGKPVSLMELAQAARREQAQASRQEKKPSVLAKLCPPVNEPKKDSAFKARGKRAAMMNFTNDEMNLMCIYQSDSRSGLIAALTEMRGYLDEDEAELRELTDSALQKLGEITDEDFAALELVPDFDTDE